MDKDILVSIVVPVYNVESYLEKCLLSIMDQTYQKIQIIVINDGSTDNSFKIAEKISNQDDRINLINQINGGLSHARNVGVKLAKGDYICFIDSDDWIEKDYVEKFLRELLVSNADMAICNMKYVYSNGDIKKRTPQIDNKQIVDGKEGLRELFRGKKYKAHAQNKMYKTSLFKELEIEFPIGKMYEDVFTTYRLIYASNKIILIPEFTYNYLQARSGSILNTEFSFKRFEILEAISEIEKFLKEKSISLKDDFSKFYVINIISLFNYLYPIYLKSDKAKKMIFLSGLFSIDTTFTNRVYNNKVIGRTEKIRYFLIKKTPLLYCYLLKLINNTRRTI